MAVRSVQVAPLREAPCGGGALGRASVLRVGGHPLWERPIPMADVPILEIELPNPERALQVDSALDFELDTSAGPACARLDFSEQTARSWTPARTGAIGISLQLDRMGVVGFLRPGVWVGAYRHGLEIGAGDSRGMDGQRVVLPFGRMMAIGWTTERLWSFPVGLYALSLVLGYQARVMVDRPADDQPRIAHGPRLVVRPFTFVGSHPPHLPVGGRWGYLAFMEVTFAYWLSADGQERAGTLGVGVTWDRPLTR